MKLQNNFQPDIPSKTVSTLLEIQRVALHLMQAVTFEDIGFNPS
jgi:hypothetical protein